MALIDVNWKPGARDLRVFSLLFAVFAAGFGTLFYFTGKFGLPVSQGLWIAAAVVGIGGLLAPRLVLPVYIVMMAIALPVGMVVSTVLMMAIYFLLLTPIGWALRLFGHDAMRRKLDAGVVSYWIERPAKIETRRYFKQY